MPVFAIVSIQDLNVCHTYQADAPVPYGGPWGNPMTHTHIIIPNELEPDCIMAVRDDTTQEIKLQIDSTKALAKTEMQWSQLRSERNRRLADTDWTRIDDVPLSEVQRAEWRIYRQALRELPSNTLNPANPVWPEIPQ